MHPEESKMNVFAVVLFLTLETVVVNSVSDCSPPIANITCSCSGHSLSCSGTQNYGVDILEVITNVTEGFFNGNISSVDIAIANLTLHPNSSFNNLPVTSLKLSSGLSLIETGLLSGISTSLEVLNFSLNNFDKVPARALMNLKKLHTLDFSHNELQVLQRTDFERMNMLKILNLGHNVINDVENETFTSLQHLEAVHLDYNNLINIKQEAFKGLLHLNHLSISANKLEQLDPQIFAGLTKLQTLHVNRNNFSDISYIEIASASLQELSAQHCFLLGSLKEESFKNVPGLISLDLSSNNLTTVEPSALFALSHLQHLNLSYNEIKTLGDNAFAAVFGLITLDLQHNDLSVVAKTAFYNLTNLKYLNLNHNKLQAFLCEYTVDLQSLEAVHLENNQIKMIRSGAFGFSLNLQELKLGGNDLNCSCFMYDFAEYLINRSSHWNENSSLIKCNSPPSLQGRSVIDVDFTSLSCNTLAVCESTRWNDSDDDDDDDNATITQISVPTGSVTSVYLTTENNISYSSTSFTSVSSKTESIPVYPSAVSDISMVKNTTSSLLEDSSISLSTSTTQSSSSYATDSAVTSDSTTDGNSEVNNMTSAFIPQRVTPTFSSPLSSELDASSASVTEETNTTSAFIVGVVNSTLSESNSSFVSDAVSDNNTAQQTSDSSTTVSTTVLGYASASGYRTVTQETPKVSPAGTSTVSSTTAKAFSSPFIIGKYYQKSNSKACFKWSTDQKSLSGAENCKVSYPVGNANTHRKVTCPKSGGETVEACIVKQYFEICVEILDGKNKVLSKACNHSHVIDTTTERPLSSAVLGEEATSSESSSNDTFRVHSKTNSPTTELVTSNHSSTKFFTTPFPSSGTYKSVTASSWDYGAVTFGVNTSHPDEDFNISSSNIVPSEAAMSGESRSQIYSQDIPFVLIGLFILVVCILVFFAVKAVFKKVPTAAYNVNEAEEKLSLRKDETHQTSQNPSARFSYNEFV